MVLFAYLALAAAPPEDRLPPAQALPPPTGEEQSVLSTVNALLATLSTGDSRAMLRWVYPDGRVTATGTRANSSGLRQESWAQFAQRITPSAAFQETISDPAIEIDGDAALVWAPFVVRVNGKVANCGFDHFDLVRDQGTWKVMNLTFSSRVEGCPAQ
ncbi:MAG TPA: nuclear transport factor 2 family protein [Sphingomicrobium sp.]